MSLYSTVVEGPTSNLDRSAFIQHGPFHAVFGAAHGFIFQLLRRSLLGRPVGRVLELSVVHPPVDPGDSVVDGMVVRIMDKGLLTAIPKAGRRTKNSLYAGKEEGLVLAGDPLF
jgi:hypothetical protein